MHLITYDFETFYDRDYSLSKLTTEEYIRDELFEVVGVSVKLDDNPTVWFSGNRKEVHTFLKQFPWDDAIAVAHNSMFDAAILGWIFGIHPKRLGCTLSMARALHGSEMGVSLAALAKHYGLGEKGNEVVHALGKGRIDFTDEELDAYGVYCQNDTELCRGLFDAMAPSFSLPEFKLIDLTLRMFTEPVLELDWAGLDAHLFVVKEEKRRLMDRITVAQADLMSNPKLAELLQSLGVEPPTKISPRTGKETWAFGKTDEDFKALLDHENFMVQAIITARLGIKSTLEETRTQRFIDISQRGKLPVPLRYYAAHTGRWGGTDKINLQNLPRDAALKRFILAPEGYLFCDCDSSQIEARILAWLAGQYDLVDAFERDDDVYKLMACRIYGKQEEAIDEIERFVGKTTILGSGYGMGPPKFKKQITAFGFPLELEECKHIISTYRRTYPKIPELWGQGDNAVNAMITDRSCQLGRKGVLIVEGRDGIKLPNGMYLRYPNLRRWTNPKTGKEEYVYDSKHGKATVTKSLWGGSLTENICQALARIIIGEQMLMINKKYRVALTVHDSVGSLVPEMQAESGQEFIELCMRLRPSWAQDLPLNCKSKIGETYGG